MGTEGKTYPQEGPLTLEEFTNYFFGAATIVAIFTPTGAAAPATVEEARAGRSWEEAVGGCYYIKPNYPGRSSHVSCPSN